MTDLEEAQKRLNNVTERLTALKIPLPEVTEEMKKITIAEAAQVLGRVDLRIEMVTGGRRKRGR